MKVSMNVLKTRSAQAYNKIVSIINSDNLLVENDTLINAVYDLKICIAILVSLYDENDTDNTDLDIELDDIDEL